MPKRFISTAALGILSMQSDINIDSSYDKPMPIFNRKMACNEKSHSLPDNALNGMHPLMLMGSQANDDVLHYHQAMKYDDVDSFREAMGKET